MKYVWMFLSVIGLGVILVVLWSAKNTDDGESITESLKQSLVAIGDALIEGRVPSCEQPIRRLSDQPIKQPEHSFFAIYFKQQQHMSRLGTLHLKTKSGQIQACSDFSPAEIDESNERLLAKNRSIVSQLQGIEKDRRTVVPDGPPRTVYLSRRQAALRANQSN